MRVQLHPAYCMHARRYRESSLIMKMLTPEFGLISCLSRGSRKKNASSDLLFTPLLISWSGRGELFTLTHVEATATRMMHLPERCIIGLYLNELILKLVPGSSPSEEVFALYQTIIRLLNECESQEKVLRLFEIKLLDLVGHGLSLDREADHETTIHEDQIYRYDVGLGPVRIEHKNNTWNVVQGATLIALRSPLEMNPDSLKEAKRLMRGIVDRYLGGRSLYSREILRFMQA